jgi:predicted DNA-binding transcriptional regulator AlpA
MNQFDKLPDSAFVRQAQLLGSVLPFSGTTLWRMVKDGHFPAPAKLGAGVTAWRVGAVRAWLHKRENGIVKSHSVGIVKRAALMTTSYDHGADKDGQHGGQAKGVRGWSVSGGNAEKGKAR